MRNDWIIFILVKSVVRVVVGLVVLLALTVVLAAPARVLRVVWVLVHQVVLVVRRVQVRVLVAVHQVVRAVQDVQAVVAMAALAARVVPVQVNRRKSWQLFH